MSPIQSVCMASYWPCWNPKLKPSWMHWKLPYVLTQIWGQFPLLLLHSSTSAQQNIEQLGGYQSLHVMHDKNTLKQESPPTDGGSAKRYVAHPRATVVFVTCSENVYARPCNYSHAQLGRDNNTTSAIYIMRRRRSFLRPRMKTSNSLDNRKWSIWVNLCKNYKRFWNRLNCYWEIATRIWPKMSTFMRIAADRKRWWRHFRSKC